MNKAALLLLAITWLGAPREAAANGAFPDSQSILLPTDRPDEIELATNFGLVVTRDGGATWFWVCEPAIGQGLIFLYQVAPAPADTLFAIGGRGLYRSDDACAWTAAGGALTGASPSDAFVDPSNPNHVVAIATRQADGGTTPSGVYSSSDSGHTFGPPLIESTSDLFFSSLEIPRTAPTTLYVTQYAGRDAHPYFLRSTDGGQTFTRLDLVNSIGLATPRIAAVHPQDPKTLYLRAQGTNGDSLAISTDGGDTFTVPLQLSSRLTAFLRRDNGTLLAGDANGKGYRSTDNGKTFTDWPIGIHLRGLGERDGHLYVVAASVGENFQVAVTDDEGAHFQPLLKFADICGPLPCTAVQTACTQAWAIQAATLGASGSPNCPRPDGGFSIADLSTASNQPESSCTCSITQRPAALPTLILCLVAVVALGRLMRRR